MENYQSLFENRLIENKVFGYRFEKSKNNKNNKIVFYANTDEYPIEYGYGKQGSIKKELLDIKNPLVVYLNDREFADPKYENPYILKGLENENDYVIFKVKDTNSIISDIEFYVKLN
jgi:hypothetical protein